MHKCPSVIRVPELPSTWAPRCPPSARVSQKPHCLEYLECPSALNFWLIISLFLQVLSECPPNAHWMLKYSSSTPRAQFKHPLSALHCYIELSKNFSKHKLFFTSLNQLWEDYSWQKQIIWKLWNVCQLRKERRISYDPKNLSNWKFRRVLFMYILLSRNISHKRKMK